MNPVCCLFTHCQSFPSVCQVSITICFVNDQSSGIFECCLLSIKIWSIWLCPFPSGDVQVNLWILRCGNILLRVRFFNVAKLTTLTPLSLLILCKVSFPVVGLKYVPYLHWHWNLLTEFSFGTHVDFTTLTCPAHSHHSLLPFTSLHFPSLPFTSPALHTLTHPSHPRHSSSHCICYIPHSFTPPYLSLSYTLFVKLT
jgi:hypothetical protein